ncbi:MAG TPA: hypothetical protein VLI93_01155 [Acetobacteraceae bacterium]|nr:hypothetical protein [Acetobacteraceae bacterium]
MKIDAANLGKIRRPEDPHRAVAGVGDKHKIDFFCVADALRFIESGDALLPLLAWYIDHLDRVVAKRGDDQALATAIEDHVVDPPADIGQRNRTLENQRWFGGGRGTR